MVAPPSQLFPESTITKVRQSWSLMNSDTEAIGYGILMKIFDKHPEYQQKFKNLKTVPVKELETNQEFLMHCGRVGRALKMVVENLDKPDALVPALLNLGKRHVNYAVLSEHLLAAEPIILDFIVVSLKEHAKQDVLEAWKDVLHAGVATMIEGQQSG